MLVSRDWKESPALTKWWHNEPKLTLNQTPISLTVQYDFVKSIMAANHISYMKIFSDTMIILYILILADTVQDSTQWPSVTGKTFSKNNFTIICCDTLRLCVSPLAALWPLPNLWLTLWRRSSFWGSPLSDLINQKPSSQAAGSPSFSGCCCIVFFLSPSLHRYAALILLLHYQRTL